MTATFNEFVENGGYFRSRIANDMIVYDCILCNETGLYGETGFHTSQIEHHEASFNHVNNARAFELERAKEILAELVRHGTAVHYGARDEKTMNALSIVVDDAREFLRSIE